MMKKIYAGGARENKGSSGKSGSTSSGGKSVDTIYAVNSTGANISTGNKVWIDKVNKSVKLGSQIMSPMSTTSLGDWIVGYSDSNSNGSFVGTPTSGYTEAPFEYINGMIPFIDLEINGVDYKLCNSNSNSRQWVRFTKDGYENVPSEVNGGATLIQHTNGNLYFINYTQVGGVYDYNGYVTIYKYDIVTNTVGTAYTSEAKKGWYFIIGRGYKISALVLNNVLYPTSDYGYKATFTFDGNGNVTGDTVETYTYSYNIYDYTGIYFKTLDEKYYIVRDSKYRIYVRDSQTFEEITLPDLPSNWDNFSNANISFNPYTGILSVCDRRYYSWSSDSSSRNQFAQWQYKNGQWTRVYFLPESISNKFCIINLCSNSDGSIVYFTGYNNKGYTQVYAVDGNSITSIVSFDNISSGAITGFAKEDVENNKYCSVQCLISMKE